MCLIKFKFSTISLKFQSRIEFLRRRLLQNCFWFFAKSYMFDVRAGYEYASLSFYNWMLYRVFQENKAHQIFRKNKHFLPPDTHTYVRVFGKFGVLCFLEDPFWDSPFCLITDEMSRISQYEPSPNAGQLSVPQPTFSPIPARDICLRGLVKKYFVTH